MRLLEGHSKVLLTRPIVIEAVTATLEAPASLKAGGSFQVAWTGPKSDRDTIRLAEVGSAPDTRVAYAFPAKNPVAMTAPDKAGEYELRYVTGQSKTILASLRIQVGATSASLEAPPEVEATGKLVVKWEGPKNSGDVINVVSVASGKRLAWGYPGHGNPVEILAPVETGEFEIRYQTGQARTILARAPLRVVPAASKPGTLLVEAAGGGPGLAGSAVEIILDASGSMLQRMGAERRIDVAKRTLTELTSEVIPSGAAFALRVFGKEVGSCQTDLEIALAPLDRAAVSARIASIEAKNNAKTPIAASLAKVKTDLGAVKGERVIVLITDGEETCDGDPAAAIGALRSAGFAVRVSIVGFAIADQGLRETFEEWADLGGGAYFDANDAGALRAALRGALERAFEVSDGAGKVVASGLAGGDPVTLKAGAYTVKSSGSSQAVTIESGRTSNVRFE